MKVIRKEIVLEAFDLIVTISFVLGHETSYSIDKTVQVYDGNAYVDYDEAALDTVVNFIGIDMLDRYVKEQLGEVA